MVEEDAYQHWGDVHMPLPAVAGDHEENDGGPVEGVQVKVQTLLRDDDDFGLCKESTIS